MNERNEEVSSRRHLQIGNKKVLIERDINNNDECMKYYVRIEVLYKRTTLE